jgi:2-keto-4-pentenoate hydratase/2-oxohepta-3-ene-1,7-dioic acid hydratase in catechol pathway
MHLVSFTFEGRHRVGVKVSEEQVVDLADATAAAASGDMTRLIAGGEPALVQAREFVRTAQASPDQIRSIPIDRIRFRPPVPHPGKILGIALNNSASDARRISGPSHPMFFMKPPTCLIGHGEDIEVRSYYGGLHPEPELGVVIAKRGRDLDPSTAMDWVFGYTIVNDITGNAMRAQDMVHYWALYAKPDKPEETERREQHLSYAARYKGTDGFGPMGPWLVTKDAVPDPHALDVTCTLGGVVLAEDSTQYLTYKVPEVLAFISRFLTLEPGDIISMGTAFRPSASSTRSLHTGDLQRFDGPLEVTITGLGTLSNGVKRSDPELPDWRLPK